MPVARSPEAGSRCNCSRNFSPSAARSGLLDRPASGWIGPPRDSPAGGDCVAGTAVAVGVAANASRRDRRGGEAESASRRDGAARGGEAGFRWRDADDHRGASPHPCHLGPLGSSSSQHRRTPATPPPSPQPTCNAIVFDHELENVPRFRLAGLLADRLGQPMAGPAYRGTSPIRKRPPP